MSAQEQVRTVLQRFQEGYQKRDSKNLDEFMNLFSTQEDVELIGIGAFERGGNEWFMGRKAIAEIITLDWKFWGDVILDVAGAKINVLGDTAWLSSTGTLAQRDNFDQVMPFYLNSMQKIMDDAGKDLETRMMEVTHYGLRRMRERQKGAGFGWPFVLTAVLVKEDGEWRFHMLHWAMPVD